MFRTIDQFLDKFSRVTSTGRFIPELDGLRAVAISAVLLQHLQQALRSDEPVALGIQLLTDATIGVELFFVISGFILALPFASFYAGSGKAIDLQKYYVRRVTRLEPPYALHLVIIFFVLIISGASFSDYAPHFLASLFYVSNVVYGQFPPLSLNSVTWSLEIEVQFYVIAPFLAMVFKLRYRRTIIILVTLLVFGLKYSLEKIYGPLPPTLITYLPYFSAGFLIADSYINDWHEKSPTLAAHDLIAVAVWTSLILVFQLNFPMRTLVVATLLYFAVSSSMKSLFIKRFLANKIVRTIGGMCYSIYLLHLIIINLLISHFELHFSGATYLGMATAMVVIILPTLALSAAYFLLIEKPCMQFKWRG